MPNEDLKQHLSELQKTLADASQLKPGEEDVLSQLMEEMVVLSSSEDVAPENDSGILEQLEKQATDFELNHPKIGAVLRQIMEALEKMGI